jgi:glycosyltransferase involved in cell wall biosynthesis
MSGKTIVAFGHFDLDGARSWVIRTGLAEHGYSVELCRTEARGLVAKCKDLHRQWKAHAKDAAAIYVVFLGHYLMPLAWWLGRRARIPVIFDAFLSLHDTEVHDRRRVLRYSPKAALLWFADWLGCALADVVLLDTEEHKEYFVKTFGIDPQKILVLPVGARSDLFRPTPEHHHEGFVVEFHGTHIPLQGVDVVITAAREFVHQGVTFSIIGPASLQALCTGISSIHFHRSVPIGALARFVHEADVCLGIFGTTTKASRVIPNKAYEAIACGKPLITARTVASERIFKDHENALLCPPGDARALAEAIRLLKRDDALRKRIAHGGHALSSSHFTPARITAPLHDWLSAHL